MNWQRISKDNLPDSEQLVIVAHEEEPNYARLCYLEIDDDSEGNGEPYWGDAEDDSVELALDDFTHWCLYVPPGR